jgi:hypothetical protein
MPQFLAERGGESFCILHPIFAGEGHIQHTKKAEISIPTGSPHQLHYQTIFVTLPLPF